MTMDTTNKLAEYVLSRARGTSGRIILERHEEEEIRRLAAQATQAVSEPVAWMDGDWVQVEKPVDACSGGNWTPLYTHPAPGNAQWCAKCGEGVIPGLCRRKDVASASSPPGNATQAAGVQWISVDDRLPDTGRRVLACNPLGYVGAATYSNGHWNGIGRANGWMELPKPLPASPAAELKKD